MEGSGSMQDRQQPLSIPLIILRFFEISPARIVANLGMIPGFFTIYCCGILVSRVKTGAGLEAHSHQLRRIPTNREEL